MILQTLDSLCHIGMISTAFIFVSDHAFPTAPVTTILVMGFAGCYSFLFEKWHQSSFCMSLSFSRIMILRCKHAVGEISLFNTNRQTRCHIFLLIHSLIDI